ncbi:MAG: DUF503 domain-containing protein [Actinomycetota bacterium]|nr:DUF503 domain-containing protein [Actinomycetota bacterium]
MGTVVGLLELDLIVTASDSLKSKRRVIKSLTQRLKSRYNLSVKEISGQDLIQRSLIGVSAVSSSESEMRDFLERIIDLTIEISEAELVGSKIHIFHSNDDE